MKRLKVVLLLVIVFLAGSLNAQFYKGNVVFDLNIGYSLVQNIKLEYKDAIKETDHFRLRPLSLRGEYFLSERFSLGGEVNYRKSDLSFELDGKVDTLIEAFSLTTSQLRIMAKGNFHIVNNPKVDWYIGLSLGYVNRSLRLKNITTGMYDEYAQYFDWSFGGFDLISFIDFPIASRFQMGLRYRLTTQLGLNLESGIGGGSFFNGGLSFMF